MAVTHEEGAEAMVQEEKDGAGKSQRAGHRILPTQQWRQRSDKN